MLKTRTALAVDLNYEDTWHVAAGLQYKASELLLLSLGIAYDSSMMDDEERSPSVPLGKPGALAQEASIR